MFATLAGFILGVGCYSYIASWGVMPILLVLTWLLMWRAGHGLRPVVLSALAFAVPVSLAPVWIAFHPEMARETLARYARDRSARVGALQTYLTPDRSDRLVRSRRSEPDDVHRAIGFRVAAGCGSAGRRVLVALWRRRDWIAVAIVIGLIAAPIPAALKGEPAMIQRALYALPFRGAPGGIRCRLALAVTIRARHRAGSCCSRLAMQFGYFYFDFFTHYKFRSAFYYDPAAFRDVAAYLIGSG